ncbi:MAG: response regulator [Planctomycetia bacterium]|nr:response regulator [Planctomycetia bacterium]
MISFFTHLFETSDFPARWHCGNWTDAHGWLHICSDLAIWSAYYTIPGILVYFAARKKDLPFKKVFLLFGAFILACGTTHLMDAIIFWWPAYRLAGTIKFVTAVVSWATVAALIPNVPRVLRMKTPEALEREVTDRTHELFAANEALRLEIAERKNAEKSLREQREWFRVTLASIGDAVMATDAEGRITFLNPCAETLTEWNAADAEGKPLEEVFRIVQEGTEKAVENPVAKVLRDNVTVGLANHTELLTRHGRRISIDDSAAPIRSEDGVVRGVVLVFHDITERRRAERRTHFLSTASEAFATLVDFTSTIQKIAHLAVPQFADWCLVDLLGADGSREHAIRVHGDASRESILADLRPTVGIRGAGEEASSGSQLTAEPEAMARMLGADPSTNPTNSALASLAPRSLIGVTLSIESRVIGRIVFGLSDLRRTYHSQDLDVAKDLARRASIALENARLHQELREADRRKDEFLAMLAHELRNPLAPIRNALALLSDLEGQEEMRAELHAIMSRQVDHIVRLVDDLLDVSRIMRGKIELRLESVSLEDVLRRAVETTLPLFDHKRQKVELTFTPEPIHLKADSVRLCQVVSNLLHNASKYSPEGAHVRLFVTREQGGVAIHVRDEGMGIEKVLLPKVFDLFTQSDRSVERAQGGLGIGLTVVRSIVEMHGGTVEAHSEGPDLGSEFIVRLANEVATTVERREEWKPGPVLPLKVLVVEDNVGSAMTLATMLRKFWKHEVVVAYDGISAVEKAEEFLPQLVLLDIGLPGLSGYEVAKRLRERPRLAPIYLVALTGYGQSEDRRRSLDAGFDDHMVKPVSVKVLEEIFPHVLPAART